MLQRNRNVIEAIEKSILSVWVHGEFFANAATWHFNGQPFDIDGDFSFRVSFDNLPKFGHGLFAQLDNDQTVFSAVVAKDIAETRCDYGVESALLNRPNRVFARRTNTKTFASNQD